MKSLKTHKKLTTGHVGGKKRHFRSNTAKTMATASMGDKYTNMFRKSMPARRKKSSMKFK